jgi:hypothetical protein
VGQDVGKVQSSHGQFGDDHLGESREGANMSGKLEYVDVYAPEDTVSVGLEGTETGGSREVSSLHDTTRDEDPVGQRRETY